MLTLPSCRGLFLAAGIAWAFASCTELPNDVGVRRHRSVATQTQWASHHPILSSWDDNAPSKGARKILANLTTQQAFVYRGEVLVGQTTRTRSDDARPAESALRQSDGGERQRR